MVRLAQIVDAVVVNQFELPMGATTIGRHPDNDIVIDEVSVSGHHARITVEKNRYLEGAVEIYFEDLSSTNGSYINGKRSSGRQLIVNNDTVSLAWNEFKVQDESAASLEKTAYILRR